MAEAIVLERSHPLASRRIAAGGIDVAPAGDAFRVGLRCKPDAMMALSEALGLPLPDRPKTSHAIGSRVALWLGPDEWLIIDDTFDPSADLVSLDQTYSAVDLSHRNVAIEVTGAGAADLIAHGCPQDLSISAFPVGACSRTVFGKVEIVLYRLAQDVFRIEVWRSFADYVFTYLSDAVRDYR